MKQLQRLLIQQGHKCFFCGHAIPAGEASVEHLDATSNGGEKTDQNCVACCRAMNTALGNLTVKEKIRALLSQPSPFPCPHQAVAEESDAPATQLPPSLLDQVMDMLRRYGDKLPRRKNTLLNAVRGEAPEVTEEQFNTLFDTLLARGVISMRGVKVLYPGVADEA